MDVPRRGRERETRNEAVWAGLEDSDRRFFVAPDRLQEMMIGQQVEMRGAPTLRPGGGASGIKNDLDVPSRQTIEATITDQDITRPMNTAFTRGLYFELTRGRVK